MALVKRWESSFCGSQGTEYTVEIWQEGYVGSLRTGLLGAPFFRLRHDGENAEIWDPIRSSECTAYIEYQDSQDQDLLNDLLLQQESDFYMRILKGGSQWWTGIILQDNFEEIDECGSRIIEITAIDGLARLKAIEKSITNVEKRYIQRLIDILQETGNAPADFYGSSDEFLVSCFRWFPNGMATTVDPLRYLRFWEDNVNKLVDENGVGNEFRNLYEVLKSLLVNTGMRVIYSAGKFWVQQIDELRNKYLTIASYPADFVASVGTPIRENASELSEFDLDMDLPIGSANSDREYGAKFQYSGAAGQVLLNYNFSGNMKISRYFDGGVSPLASQGTGTSLASGTVYAFRILASSYFEITGTGAGYQAQYVFKGTLKLEIKVGSYYYTNAGWGTTAGYYDVKNIPIFFSHDGTSSSNKLQVDFNGGTTPSGNALWINLQIPAAPAAGELFLKGNIVISNVTSSGFGLTRIYDEVICITMVSQAPNQSTEIQFKAESSKHPSSTKILDLGEVYLGDNDTGTYNFLEYYNLGTAQWGRTTYWQKGGAGTQLLLGEMITQEMLALHNDPERVFRGTVTGPYSPHKALWYNRGGGIIYKMIYQGGTFTAQDEAWRGSWRVLDYDITSITLDDNGIGFMNGIASSGGSGLEPGLGLEAGRIATVQNSGGLSGTITSIPIASTSELQVKPGEWLRIFDPISGNSDRVQVNSFEDATAGAGITSIPVVSASLSNTYRSGAVILRDLSYIGNNIHRESSYSSDGTLSAAASFSLLGNIIAGWDGTALLIFTIHLSATDLRELEFQLRKTPSGGSTVNISSPYVVKVDESASGGTYRKTITLVGNLVAVDEDDKLEVHYKADSDTDYTDLQILAVNLGK